MARNEIYQKLEGNRPDMQAEYSGFMQDPFAYMANKKIGIPKEYQNDPHSAVQYLLNSGQMNQQAFNRVFSTLQKMGFRFN